jgi:hypothetical protein
MAWIRNLISRPGNPSSDDAEAGVPSHPDAVGARPPSPPGSPEPELELGTGLLPPTTHMTGHQFFYIFIMDGIIAMILSGGINFAVAYGKLGSFPWSIISSFYALNNRNSRITPPTCLQLNTDRPSQQCTPHKT